MNVLFAKELNLLDLLYFIESRVDIKIQLDIYYVVSTTLVKRKCQKQN